MNDKKVTHEGIVKRVEGRTVFVHIQAQSACAKCHARSVCGASDKADKVIEAVSEEDLQPGDRVVVEIEPRMGWLAVLYSFVIPFLILATVLFSVVYFTGSEPLGAGLGLVSLVPYYFVLFLLRKKMAKQFNFTATKINSDKRGEK